MDFISSVRRTTSSLNKKDSILNASLGIAGESGEIVDYIKKHFYQGHILEVEKLKEEVGDVLFYLQWLADLYNFSIFDSMHDNTLKRMKRFPKGFSNEASVNRVDYE